MNSKHEKMSMSEAGSKGGKKTKLQYGKAFYKQIGMKGGKTTSKEYGPAFYHKIGSKGGKRVSELIKEGKKMEGKNGGAAKSI